MHLKYSAMVGENVPTFVKMFSKSTSSQYSNEILAKKYIYELKILMKIKAMVPWLRAGASVADVEV